MWPCILLLAASIRLPNMRLYITLIAIWSACASAHAQQPIERSHFAFTLAQETWALPGQERMGLTSVGLYQDLSPNFSAGLQAFTATTGRRGGFITLGASMRARQLVWGPIGVEGEFFAGGGSGAGGLELAGGGLMYRGAMGVSYTLTNGTRFSSGISRVSFPSGAIDSTHPYLQLAIPFEALTRGSVRIGGEPSRTPTSWPNVRHFTHQLLPIIKHARVDADVPTTAGQTQSDVGLVGIEWRTYMNRHWYIALSTEAAYQGASAGYMDIMGGAGISTRVSPGLSVYADAMIGGGGGGAVNTASGKLVNTRVGVQFDLGYNWIADASASRMKAIDGRFAASTLGVGLGYQFGAPPSRDPGGRLRHDVRLRLGSQTYQGIGNWRTTQGQDIGLLGAQIDYMVTPNWYLSGQAMAAATGGAGAYMTGQMGGGYRTHLSGRTFAEAEVLAGAAGGGGLSTGSGALGQLNVNLGYRLTPSIDFLVTAGRAQSTSGSFKANVLGVSLGYRLGMFTAK